MFPCHWPTERGRRSQFSGVSRLKSSRSRLDFFGQTSCVHLRHWRSMFPFCESCLFAAKILRFLCVPSVPSIPFHPSKSFQSLKMRLSRVSPKSSANPFPPFQSHSLIISSASNSGLGMGSPQMETGAEALALVSSGPGIRRLLFG